MLGLVTNKYEDIDKSIVSWIAAAGWYAELNLCSQENVGIEWLIGFLAAEKKQGKKRLLALFFLAHEWTRVNTKIWDLPRGIGKQKLLTAKSYIHKQCASQHSTTISETAPERYESSRELRAASGMLRGIWRAREQGCDI